MGKGTLMDMSFVVTNEVGQPRAISARQPTTNKVERPSVAVQFIALIAAFIAHQPPPHPRPDPSHQR